MKRKSSRNKSRNGLLLQRLEARLMFDGLVEQPVADAVTQAGVEQNVEAMPESGSGTQSISAQQSTASTLIFADMSSPEAAELTNQIIGDFTGTGGIALIAIDANRSGWDQISEALAARTGLNSIHLIGRDTPEGLRFGNEFINESTLSGSAGQVSFWESSFGSDGSLILHAPSAAVDQGLTESLSALSGLDVKHVSDTTVSIETAFRETDLGIENGGIVQTQIRKELVVIDKAITDWEKLATDTASQRSNTRQIEIVFIEKNVDGIAVVTEALRNRSGLSAIHILSHGVPGSFTLGTETVSAQVLSDRTNEISKWGDSLDEHGDILIYGCNVAEDSAGQVLVRILAQMTQADVAASTDATGIASFGGDWKLEYTAGQVAIGSELNDGQIGSWQGLLAAPTVASVSAPIFYSDSGAGLTSSYVGYRITNPGPSAIADAYVSIGTFGGGLVGLAANEDGVVHLGSLAAGESKFAYFYLTSSFTGATSTVDQTHNIRVYEGTPTTGTLLTTQSITLTDVDNSVISASANKVTTVVSTANPATIGSLMTITVTGETGTIGSAKILSFSPATYGTWRADAFELIGTQVTLSGGNSGVFSDQLYFTVANTSATNYTAVYTFRLTNTTATPTAVSPVANISSGAQIKHTSTGNFISLAPIENPINTTTLSLAVDDNSLTGSGTVTYTITLQNTGSTAVTMDRILATLASSPANISYVTGTATYNGSSIGNPTISGQNLSWNGMFVVAAGSTSTLTFQANVPANTGTYSTTAYAITGNVAIDTTIATPTGTTPDSQATVAVVVTPPSPPDAVNDTASATEDATTTGNVLTNDTDPNLDPLSVTGFTIDTDGNGSQESFSAGQTATIIGVGTLQINANGSFTFIPVANYNSAVPVATYTVSDGSLTDTATLTIGPVAAVNDPPTTTDDSVTTLEDTPIVLVLSDFGTYSDVEGASLASVRITTPPAAGTLQFFDGTSWLAVTTNQVITAADITAGKLRFTPALNQNGSPYTAVGFQVSDGSLFSATQILTVHVTPVNDAPDAIDDSFSTSKDTAVAISVKSNDTDVEGNALTISHVDGIAITAGGTAVTVTNGTVSLNVAGTQLTFTPTSGYVGSVSFTYTISDGNGGTDTATVNGTILPANQPPVDGNETNNVTEDTTLTVIDGAIGDLLNNATDADGNPLTISAFTVAGQSGPFVVGSAYSIAGVGALTINANGSYSFVPAANYTGAIPVITYTVSDGQGGTDTSTLTLAMVAVNDPPVDGNETNNVTEDTTRTVADGAAGDLLNNATDVEGNTLTISAFTIAGQAGPFVVGTAYNISGVGSLTINANGSYSFVPAANYTGAIPVITYTVSDGQGGTDTSTLTLAMVAVNDPPVDGNETNNVTEDTTLTVADGAAGDLLNNATDVEGNVLTISAFTVAGQAGPFVVGTAYNIAGVGSLTINANGSYSFAPVANYTGAIPVITYTISDGQGGTDTSTLSLAMVAVNDPPVAGNDTFTTNEDTAVTISVLANDSDVDGNPLTITQVNGTAIVAGGAAVAVTNGTVSLNAAGTQLIFTPASNYNGSASFTYTISDGNGGTATATVSGNVTAVNDPPVDGNETNNVSEDTTLTVADGAAGDLLNNATDVEGNTLTISAFTVAGQAGPFVVGTAYSITGVGSLTINANGSYSFAPAANYTGAIPVITYTVSDGQGGTDTSTLSLVMVAVNDPPVAGNDTFTTNEENAVTISVLANDSDVEGNPLTITQVNGTAITAGGAAVAVTNGTVSLNAAGTQLIFTPASNYNGPASFTYTISDGNGGTATATVSGNVTAVNDPPVANNDTFVTNEDTAVSISVLTNDNDSDGNPLTITQVNGAAIVAGGAAVAVANGTVSLNAAGTQLIFTPVANYNGPASFTYTISDGNGGTAMATVNGSVSAVNDPPVANDDSFLVNEDSSVTILALTNDSDVDGNSLSITQVNGAAIIAGGPAVPVTNGTVTLNAAGTQLTFTPAVHYNGPASFTYTVSDGFGGTSIATISGSVTAVNDPPLATNDSFTTIEDTAVTISVLSNDSDVDGNPLIITQVNGTAIVAGGAAVAVVNGTVSLNASGTQLTFTPAANYNGPASFIYTISDGNGGTAMATVNGMVNGANDPPSANADTNSTTENALVGGNVLTNDADLDGDSLTVSAVNGIPANVGASVTGSNGGSFVVNSNGSYTFNPGAAFDDLAAGQTRVTQISYTVSDGAGGTSTAAVTVTVTGTNDTPTSTTIASQTSNDSQPINLNVSSSFSDPDSSDAMTFSVSGLPAGLSINSATGMISGTIAANASLTGPYSVTVTATEPSGAMTSQTFTWNVSNPAPNAANDTNSTTENSSVGGNVRDNDTDPDGDALVVSAVNGLSGGVGAGVSGTSGGTFTIQSNGSYTFNPGAAFDDLAVGETRTTSVTYTISDGQGGSSSANVTVTVTGTNDAPTSTSIATQNSSDLQPISLNVSSGFSDLDSNDMLTFSVSGLPSGLSINPATGLISGTIAANASVTGPYSVTVTATDPSGAMTSQTFTWNVANPAPTAVNDANSTTENSSVAGNVRSNDTDPDGDTLVVSAVNGLAGGVGAAVAGASGGTFTIQSNGSYTFNPGTAFDDLAVGETRTTSVTYTISDGQGGSSTANVTVTVTGINDAPTSTSIATQNNTDSQVVSLNISGSFSDPDMGDSITFSASNLPPGLSINSTTGFITGTISSSASVGGPYSVTVTGVDSNGAATMQTFTWNVVNLAVAATADVGNTTENATTTGNVLTNDTDTDGDVLSVLAVNGIPGNVGSAVAGSSGGEFTIASNGSYSFHPRTAFDDLAAGQTRSTSVSYTATDNQGSTSITTVTITVTGTNDAPTSGMIASQLSNDADVVMLDISNSFNDPDSSDVLSYSVSGLPAGLSINSASGIISGTIHHSASVAGPYSVIVTATDLSGATTSQTFTWNVSNPSPASTADIGSTTENSSVTGNVLTNDNDPDGDMLLVAAVNGVTGNVGSGVTGSNGGLFTINSDGSYSFNPETAFDDLAVGETRSTTVSYTNSDGEGGTSTSTLTVTVTGTNDGPISIALLSQYHNDSEMVNYNVAGYFSDPDSSDLLTFTASNLPPGLSINSSTGTISGMLDSSASVGGPYSVTITATDASGALTAQTFNWVVSNVPPSAYDDSDGTTENAFASGNVLANDVDPDGDTLVVSEVNGSSLNVNTSIAGTHGGQFVIQADGSYQFSPGLDFDDLAVGETRSTSIQYTADDNNGGAVVATLTVVVTGTNDAPNSSPIGARTSFDGESVAFSIAANFSDPDASDPLSFTASNLPPGLSINLNTGVITGIIDHSASLGGPYSVTIEATDPSGATTSQTFTWNVTNPGPTANSDTGASSENGSTSGNVLTNDNDPDGDVLSVSAVDGVAGNVGTSVTGSNGGSFTINANGSYTFNPGTAFDDLAVGESRTTAISYTITDNEGGFATATVTITVTGANDAPVSTSITTQSGTDNTSVTLNVSGNFSDPDSNNVLTFSDGGTLPLGLSIDPNTGVITGTLSTSASVGGPYSVTITATDPSGATTSQTFTWNVANPGPTAVIDTNAVAAGSTTNGNVLSNDLDPDGDLLSVSAVNGTPASIGSPVTGSNGGTFTINSNGNYSFNPGTAFDDLGFGETRSTTISYTMTDSQGGFSIATVTITVTGANEAPTSTPIATQSGVDSSTVALDVSGHFTDADASDILTFSDGGTLPPGLSIDPSTGVITGTIDNSASVGGPYSVIITATDLYGATTSQTFTWHVTNPGPTAVNDTGTSPENGSTSGNVLTNDTDPDGDVLSVSAVNGVTGNVGAGVTGSNGGSFTINANGSYTFNPGTAFDDLAVGETRTTSISYTITDSEGGSSIASVTITVTGGNDAPVSTPIATQSGTDNTSVTFDVSGNFSDPDSSDPFSFTASNLPPGLSIDPNTGVITGTIDHSASVGGPYSVTIRATDPSGVTTSQTFTWNITNPGPTANVDTGTLTEDGSTSGNVLTNDTDPDGDVLSVSAVNGVAGSVGTGVTGTNGGLFTINMDGSYTFHPGATFNDLALGESRTTSVTYTMTDSEGGSSIATVAITVTGANDVPISTPIATQSGTDNSPVTFNVSGNFSDPDSTDPLSFTASNLPPGLSIDPNTGIITGSIDHSASVGGPYSVTITATDPSGATTSQTFTWNVTNPGPTANGDIGTSPENGSTSGNVLTNDSDPDGDVLSVSAVNGVPSSIGIPVAGTSGGTFTIGPDGSYTFDPRNDFEDLAVGESRTTDVTYTIIDGEGGSSTATIRITVTGSNDAVLLVAPILDQTGSGLETINFDASSYFGDPDTTDPLSFSASDLPPGLSIDPITGRVTGTIDANAAASGPYTVTIRATDSSGTFVTSTFEWTIENTDLSVSVTDGNASSIPGGPLSYSINYHNISNVTATGVVITQAVPQHTAFDPNASTPGWIDNGDGTFSFYLGTVNPGQAGSLTFAVIVNNTLPAGVELTNTQSSIHDDGRNGTDLTPTNNTASEASPLEAQPDYSVAVNSEREFVLRGETLTTNFVVTNNGNQNGTGATIISQFPIDVLTNIAPSHGGIVDLNAGTITWNLPALAVGHSIALTVTSLVSPSAPSSIVGFSQQVFVIDDGSNGIDPTPANNQSQGSVRLLSFGFDSLNNLGTQPFGVHPVAVPPLTTRLAPLPVEPIFSGLSSPGSTLVGRIYDQNGNMIGERQVMADTSGNWMMAFPNSLVMEKPHRMEIVHTAAVQSGPSDSGFNFRRYFHPAAHSSIFFTTDISVNEVLNRSAYQMVRALHQGNQSPYSFNWLALTNEFATASTNAGQG